MYRVSKQFFLAAKGGVEINDFDVCWFGDVIDQRKDFFFDDLVCYFPVSRVRRNRVAYPDGRFAFPFIKAFDQFNIVGDVSFFLSCGFLFYFELLSKTALADFDAGGFAEPGFGVVGQTG